MKNSKQLQKVITKLAERSFKDRILLESQVIKSIKLLKSQPRYMAIPAISEYLKQLKRKQREHTLYIEAAILLSFAQIKKIKKIVEKKIKITKVMARVNPEILGGFKLRIGDEVWDESILRKMNQMKEAIRG